MNYGNSVNSGAYSTKTLFGRLAVLAILGGAGGPAYSGPDSFISIVMQSGFADSTGVSLNPGGLVTASGGAYGIGTCISLQVKADVNPAPGSASVQLDTICGGPSGAGANSSADAPAIPTVLNPIVIISESHVTSRNTEVGSAAASASVSMSFTTTTSMAFVTTAEVFSNVSYTPVGDYSPWSSTGSAIIHVLDGNVSSSIGGYIAGSTRPGVDDVLDPSGTTLVSLQSNITPNTIHTLEVFSFSYSEPALDITGDFRFTCEDIAAFQAFVVPPVTGYIGLLDFNADTQNDAQDLEIYQILYDSGIGTGLAGDSNADCLVTCSDLPSMDAAVGSVIGDPNYNLVMDFELDGDVDTNDRNAMLAAIGSACIFGDFNNDGCVDTADLGLLLGAFGSCIDCPEDLNGDGSVDTADLGLLFGAWGNGC